MNESHSNCMVCNSQFKPKKNKANKFCGLPCYRISQRNGEYKRGSSNIKQCNNCGCDVIGRSFSVKRNGEHSDKAFCNRSCYDLFRSKKRAIALVDCIGCGAKLGLLPSHNKNTKYCSVICVKEHKKSKDRNCISCGVWFSSLKFNTTIKRLVADNARKTCSKDCYISNIKNNKDRKDKISKAFTAEKHPNWQGGTQLVRRGFRGYDWKRIREIAIKRDGFKCAHCGIGRDEHYLKYNCDFNVNHIKPFFQFGGNTQLANKPSNLETLCKSCHTKADWEYRKNNQIQIILGL